MSTETASLGIMTADTFKNRTKATKNVCGFASHFKSRGSSMDGIDHALKSWESLVGKDRSHDKQRAFALHVLRLHCEQYLADKSLKNSPLAASRKSVVSELLRTSEAAESYMNKRSAPVASRPGTKSLDGAYANERTNYVSQQKQSNPFSASALHGQGAHDTYQDFVALAGQTGGKQVEFLNRAERMEHLVVIKNGLLYQNGALYSCNIKTGKGYAAVLAATYAMDKYGNLFSKKEAKATQKGLMFNHSTYCAGKEIVSAGTLTCLDGVLLKITNSSGHYKPTGMNLKSALVLLGQENVDLHGVVVEGSNLVVGDGLCSAYALVRDGAPAPADWPFQLPPFQAGKPTENVEITHVGKKYEVWEPG